MKATLYTVALAALLTCAAPCIGGVVDSPVPAPFTQHVFSVSGIMNVGFLTTFFSCTNLDVASVTVGVETFGSAGGGPSNDPVAASLAVAPGATVVFGCGTAAWIGVSSNLVCGPLTRGSARVLATSKKLLCTAWVADPVNVPPATSWQLNIVAKTKQKGD